MAKSIKARIRGGESARLEYKSTCPDPERLARIVAAFANGSGGDLAIGVDDRGEAVGIADLAAQRAAIDAALAHLHPVPEVTVEHLVHEMKDFLLVAVAPHRVFDFVRVREDGERTGRVYVRMKSETRPVDTDIVKEAARLRRRHGGDTTLTEDGQRLVDFLWERGETTETVCARKFNWSSNRLRKLADAVIAAGHALPSRIGGARGYLALTPGTKG